MRTSQKGYSRARGLRQNMSLPEVILWQHLRGGNLNGLRFRRQHPVGPFVLDFYSPGKKLAIEIDGRAHDSEQAASEDEKRTMWLNNQGIRVIRFAAAEILDDESLAGVIAMIADITAPSTAYGGPPPPPRGGGSGETAP